MIHVQHMAACSTCLGGTEWKDADRSTCRKCLWGSRSQVVLIRQLGSGVRAVGGWTRVLRACLFKVPGTCAGVGAGHVCQTRNMCVLLEMREQW